MFRTHPEKQDHELPTIVEQSGFQPYACCKLKHHPSPKLRTAHYDSYLYTTREKVMFKHRLSGPSHVCEHCLSEMPV